MLCKCQLFGLVPWTITLLLRTFIFLSQTRKQDNSPRASLSLLFPENGASSCSSCCSHLKLQPRTYSMFNPFLTQQSQVWKREDTCSESGEPGAPGDLGLTESDIYTSKLTEPAQATGQKRYCHPVFEEQF